MKKLASLLFVSLLAGTITLGAYKLFIEDEKTPERIYVEKEVAPAIPQYTPASYNRANAAINSGIDFTEAAEQTVHGVVHVKNVQLFKKPRNMMEVLRGGGESGKGIVGAGSGVIISGDGFIITNNHVIAGASEIEVTLNDNRSFKAEIVGRDEKADIALLKVETDEELPYIPFGDSDAARVGEWVLAVGNPFNLTSTVTAGIVSAKARDIDEGDLNYQSFIQTDAAINPGNSGGALVNIHGELVGINTAITSQTGSYVGYAFAVPSNNARKIVEDIMQFGSVQKGILGVRGGDVNPELAKEEGIATLEGFYIAGVEDESGAQKAGLKSGDVIKQIDNIKIAKFADLSGYISSKRPDDIVQVSILRDNKELTLPVTLVKIKTTNTYDIKRLGIQVKTATRAELKANKAKNGVIITRPLTRDMARFKGIIGRVISEVNDEKVFSIEDVKRILSEQSDTEPVSIVFLDEYGERNRFIFE